MYRNFYNLADGGIAYQGYFRRFLLAFSLSEKFLSLKEEKPHHAPDKKSADSISGMDKKGGLMKKDGWFRLVWLALLAAGLAGCETNNKEARRKIEEIL